MILRWERKLILFNPHPLIFREWKGQKEGREAGVCVGRERERH